MLIINKDKQNSENKEEFPLTEEQRKLIEVMHKFKKLNFNALLTDVNSSDWHLLTTIGHYYARHPGETLKVSTLVKKVPMPAPAVSRCLRGLEMEGYVVRTADARDRRNTLVTLTETGEKTYKAADSIMRDYFDAVFERMEPKELDEMTMLMEKMYGIAREELDMRLDKTKEDDGRNDR
jgi:DNA-binding MarR family transcriptional regulator